MKISYFFYILCFGLSTFLMSCEKQDFQKEISDGSKIEPRISSCDECPVEDCCCGVQLLTPTGTNLIICGTSSPDVTTTTCGFMVGSCTVSGFELPFSLAQTEKELFCMPQNAGFSIYSSAGATVRVSCQMM